VTTGGRAWGRGGAVAVLLTLSLVLWAEGRPGDLDPTFGVRGRVTTDFFGNAAGARALVRQPDGKLVAAGWSCQDASCAVNGFALARYLPEGRLDASFGVGGLVTTTFGGVGNLDEGARALVLQPDGKLVAGGGFSSFRLARYLPDGRLDPTFGTGGTVTTDAGSIFDTLRALVLQPDGKLVAAGDACFHFCLARLARYLPDGRLDPTFGTEGLVTVSGGFAHALVLQPDGKLVTAGSGLTRCLPDGRLDPTFGDGGRVTTDFLALALVLQPDGTLVAAGGSSPFGDETSDFALARYLPEGRLDASFGVGGRVTTDFFAGDDAAGALILQPDGKLVAAGAADGHFALARYVEQQPVFNDFVTFEPLPTTFLFTPDPTGCPAGFVGTFRFEARLTNSSDRTLSALVVEVIALTGGNLLQNADGGPKGVGAQLTVPQQEGFTDGVLSPDEFVDVPFIICLTAQEPFRLVVDVLGEAE
jgi:uncharacterized delta-60 repeat protein